MFYSTSIFVVLSLIITTSKSSIGGIVDTGHKFVGFNQFHQTENNVYPDDDPTYGRCTASIIKIIEDGKEYIFGLTAAHCVMFTDWNIMYLKDSISYEERLNNANLFNYDNNIDFNNVSNCLFEANQRYIHPLFEWYYKGPDVGLLLFDNEFKNDILACTNYTFGTLIEENIMTLLLNNNNNNIYLGMSGYGVNNISKGELIQEDPQRRHKVENFRVHLSSDHQRQKDYYFLEGSSNPNIGAQCFGDSGSPNFYPSNSNIVASVLSLVYNDQNCFGVNGTSRLDLKVVRDWIINCVTKGICS